MSVEESLYEVRLAKANALRAAGENPFANDFRPTATTADVFAACGELDSATLELPESKERYRYAIAGRAVTWRSFGKATFFHLQDRSGRLQVYVRKDLIGDEAFARFKDHVENGDIIAATGRAFRTKTGELSLEATAVRLLTKALRPLPEKWHGLTDKETRYRQRWLDLITNGDVRAAFERRSEIIRRVRGFLDARGFMEVETPMMHPIKGGATARPFVTHHNALGMDLFMRVAPELYLKRLVTGGFERVYEINRNFRNEGLSSRHNPEFTMLEFYQAYARYEDLMDLTEEMFTELVAGVNAGSLDITYQGRAISFARPWRRVSMEDAVRAVVPELDALLADPAAGEAYARSLGATYPPGVHPGRGQLLLDLFEKKVEHDLVNPTFITDFPAEVSPLARRKDSNPEQVDRFELFIAGMEVANAFSELNDPVDQEQRFRAQAAAGAAGDAEAMEYDANYVLCLEYGMPPTAGEGVGIDRLCMLLTDQPSIRDIILFPLLRKEQTT